MAETKKPLSPVTPKGFELVFFYECPGCKKELPLVAPTQPAMVKCGSCGMKFPVAPVEKRALQFFRLMTQNGQAAIESEYL
ncbi:hypothetical protein [Desulfobaculum bizertense]|uniref:Uncharacterized protein n=1 Tax=Desulfobaculum bizertense DSM 18034 TaxID=1121442 RepID=A0A1T4WVP0_9BACT|nr:hypothetical protein [Desulfobaculum bizertense]UIJ38600.1 hypothetical protein LWC08_03250 [Desulfobaculum bizertense]SKA81423.1 hypothetical protein SAMN02745702_02709 [Desulfobaculum bizertense DSM 18034]